MPHQSRKSSRTRTARQRRLAALAWPLAVLLALVHQSWVQKSGYGETLVFVGVTAILLLYRLLHGRTAYQLEGGVRHMRQGYVDRDSTASRRQVLRHTLAGSVGANDADAPRAATQGGPVR